MENARLVRIMNSLSPGRLRAFRRYVASPFFNRNARLEALLDWLMEHLPAPPDDKPAIHRVLFGTKKAFDEQRVYDHFSALLRLLEGYLSWEAVQADPFVPLQHLTAYLLEAEEGQFERYHKKLRQTLKARPHRNSGYFQQRYQTYLLADSYFGRQQRRVYDENLAEAEASLDTYYLAAKLQHACEMLNRNNIINRQDRPQMMDSLESELTRTDNPYREVPVIRIYFLIYLSLSQPEEEAHYEALVSYLQQHAGDFTREEAYAMYGYALNYCTRKINEGQGQYLEKIFLLFRQLLDQDILIEGGYLAHWHVKNIVTVGLRLREFQWVKGFLDTYRVRMHPEQREHVYHFFLATYHYEQQEYPEALRALQQVVFTDVYYDLGARSMLLKIYYEAEEYEALDYHIRAFQTYLRRNKDMSAGHRKVHRNLIRFVRKLRKLRKHSDPERLEAGQADLLKEIAAVREVADRKWVLAQIQKLEEMYTF
ncbi:MAG: hypothetical protein D6722_03845 [Bacteroidetes bacterium]|nr:MAG: hypothetical protein D6722_03845 [Bacteroidota bacterium]